MPAVARDDRSQADAASGICKRPAAYAIANAAADNAVLLDDLAAMGSSAKIRAASSIAGGNFSGSSA